MERPGSNRPPSACKGGHARVCVPHDATKAHVLALRDGLRSRPPTSSKLARGWGYRLEGSGANTGMHEPRSRQKPALRLGFKLYQRCLRRHSSAPGGGSGTAMERTGIEPVTSGLQSLKSLRGTRTAAHVSEPRFLSTHPSARVSGDPSSPSPPAHAPNEFPAGV